MADDGFALAWPHHATLSLLRFLGLWVIMLPPKKLFVRQSVLEMVNQYINTWWHQLLINGSTLQRAPIHRKCNAVIICRKYNVDTQRIMLGFQLFEMWGKYILYCKSHQLCKTYPFSDVTAISVQKGNLANLFCRQLRCNHASLFRRQGNEKHSCASWQNANWVGLKVTSPKKRCDLDLLITSNPEGFDPFCLSFSHLPLFVSFLGKFWEAEASSRLLRLHISFFLQLTAATGVAFWKKL